MPFFEHQGVYYMKYKVDAPDVPRDEPVFARPVP